MKSRIVVLSGVVMAFISLMLLMPGTVSAVTLHTVNLSASGDQTGFGPGVPTTADLSWLATPATSVSVNIMDGDSVKVKITLAVSHWNDYWGDNCHSALNYDIDFYQVDSTSVIVYSITSAIYANGPLGSNSVVIEHIYDNVYEDEFMRVDIDLDLLSIGNPDPIPIHAMISSTTTTIITAT